MKSLFVIIFILLLSTSVCSAQWKDFHFGPPSAFGVHDDTLFASQKGGGVSRYDPTIPYPDEWVRADNGLAPSYSDKAVTCFGSIGSAILAGANATNAGYIADFRSIDNGSTWSEILPRIQSNCFLTIGDTIYSGGASGVYYSIDSGVSWSLFSTSQRGVNSLAVVGTILFEGTNSGVYRSVDNGQNWTQTGLTIGINRLAILGSSIFAGTFSGIYRSIDNGINWTIVDTGLFNHYINSLVSDGKNLFAGTGVPTANGTMVEGSGVFLSTDSGGSWDTVNTGLPEGLDGALNISTLFIYDTLLIAGTWDNAGQEAKSYARPINEMAPKSAVREAVVVSDSIEVYPNPASGLLSIRSVGSSILGIEVLNVLGENVLDVPNRSQSDITLDLSKLPSGTYFLQIETEKGTVMRKVVRE